MLHALRERLAAWIAPPKPPAPPPPPRLEVGDALARMLAEIDAVCSEREEELRAQARASDSHAFRDKQHARADETKLILGRLRDAASSIAEKS